MVGQILQAQLRQVGINLILLHKDLADWDAINQRGEFAFMLYTPQVIYMDPDNFCIRFCTQAVAYLRCSNWVTLL